MKISFKYVAIVALAAAVFSCKKDNYAPPSAILSGALLYQGDTIQVEKNAVHFQIFQYGFGKVGPISTDETFAENGTYSATLFNGDYKLIVPNGDGPFMWKQTTAGVPDSLSITINGSQSLDLEVTPYFLVRNANITAVGTDSVTATFKAEKIINDVNAKDLDYAVLFINKTQFVAGSNNVAAATIPAGNIVDFNSIQLGVKVPAMTPTQSYVYARIGLKISGVEDLIFSPLVKVSL